MRQQIRLRSVKFLLLSVLSLWLIGFPGVVSEAQVVDIPDPGLRAAIAEALNKAPGETITRAEMETLVRLDAISRDITDLRGIEFAINLTGLNLNNNTISDISPLSSLTNLISLHLENNNVSDISSLTNLRDLYISGNTISDISALASLTNLESLGLNNNTISDISPLASLTKLKALYLHENDISDISALASLTNLDLLYLQNNNISDIETIERLIAQGTVVYFSGNPAFETPGPKIEDGWVWLIVPATDVGSGHGAALSGRDFLSEASGGAVTEADVALNGASAGTQVGDSVWTSAPLNAADLDNLNAIVRDYNLGTDIDYPVAYGVVSIQSETQQQTRVYIGRGPVKVWLNGTLIYKGTEPRLPSDYETAVPVVLNAGENVLFVAAYRWYEFEWGAFFGFQDGTGYTVGAPGAGGAVVSVEPPVVPSPAVGERLTVRLHITGGEGVAGYEADVNFDPTAVKYVSHANGDYLPAGAITVPAEPTENSINVSAVAIGATADGDGTLATVTFEVVEVKTSTLRLTSVIVADAASEPLEVTTVDGMITADGKPGLSPNAIDDQTFVVNTPIEPLFLPLAIGGTAPYTYTLTPIPSGLLFDATIQLLSGTPTTVEATSVTYTVTDANDASASLMFTITVTEETSLAEQVFEKYRALFQREDIQALLPPFLVGLKDPEIQPLLNAATIGLVVDNPDLLTNFIPDIDPAFVTLLKEDADLQTMLRDPLVHALLQDPAAIDELLGLLGSTLPDVVNIPDPNLRAAIAEALNKAPGDAITRAEMETLTRLLADIRDITDLRGIEFAINLTYLALYGNTISDIAPLSSLTNLTGLALGHNTISDISPLSNLTNLTYLLLYGNTISDIAPLVSLTNLTTLSLRSNNISDISPLASLTNLGSLYLSLNNISDISPLARLTNLMTELDLRSNNISDISPLSSLTNLRDLSLYHNNISDISPLARLTNLRDLNLANNTISDISALASLTNLTSLYIENNNISDISPLATLTNLTELDLRNNQIRDVFPLIGLINLEKLWLAGNPIEDLSPLEALIAQNPGVIVDILRPPKITGPWLWMIAPTESGQGGAASTDVDSLAVASGGTVTETDVAINGAAIGDRVGNYAWTPAEITDTGRDNITHVVNNIGFAQGDVDDHSSYALISFTSATALSGVRMYVGSDDSIKVWLNGQVVHTNPIDRGASDFQDIFQVDLVAGNNLLLVKVSERSVDWTMFVGIDAEVTVLPPGEPGDPIDLPLDVNGDGQVNVIDLAIVALFYGTRVPVGVSLPADVNADGIVNVADFVAVAAGVDAANPLPQGMEWVLLAALEQAIEVEGVAEAPTGFRTPQHDLFADIVYGNVAAALADARLLVETGDARLRKGIALLETLLELLTEMRAIPETTTLLPNYPNPFNPETWMPYHLANASSVQITIFDARGSVVRQLDLGHQQAGYYMSKARAAYWDGRNDLGEAVASGVYFYQLQADNTSMLRKMLILK